MRSGRTTLAVAVTLLAIACTTDDATPEPPEAIRVLAHDSFADGVTAETFADFTAETDIPVEVLAGGDAGSTVNQAILTRDNPVADVLFGVDDAFLSRALEEDLFVPYVSDLAPDVIPSLFVDEQNRVTPIDFGDVCLNYDVAWFEEAGLAPPATLEDLVAPEYESLLVVQDPARSSPGLAFLLATIDRFGTEWPGYWESLVSNDVAVVADWSTAYYTDFTHYGGERPVVVSYASSPPAEVMFADEPLDEAPTGVVTDGCYRQIEFAGILVNTDNAAAAGQLIDFMLTPAFQETIPETWFVFPANDTVELPEVFADHTVLPDDPVSLEPSVIAAERDDWLATWRQVVDP